MGSPLAPIIADIVLEYVFDMCIPKFTSSPTILKKYVDDILITTPLAEIDGALYIINSFHEQLKFTVEIEENNSLPYLDLKLYRKNNKIITDWYSKPTSSNQLLNFHSAHPMSQKINVATNLISRILNLSHKTFENKNIELIYNILTKNNYPRTLITKLIHKIRKKFIIPVTHLENLHTTNHSTENKKFTSITYIKGLSESINKTITQNYPNISMAFKPQNKIKNILFTNNKQKIDTKQQSGVVYKINCSSCDAVYIGETSKKLSTRIKQHKRDLTNILTEQPKTSLISHTKQTGHIFKYDESKIIDHETNRSKRILLEASHILLNSPNSVNIKNDVKKINEKYLSPLSIYKQISPTQ